jgi:nitrogen fixation protein NifU and related proteins
MSERSLEQEIVDHAMNPKNYGKLEDADGVGVGVDPSDVYLIYYIKVDGETLTDIAFATSGSQDALTLGSMLSEMVKGDTLTGVQTSIAELEAQVEALYQEKEERIEAMKAAGSKKKISMKEQDQAAMTLAALQAALINRENRLKGIDEEQYRIVIADRGGDFVKKGCSH